jgi:sulfofructose kinase
MEDDNLKRAIIQLAKIRTGILISTLGEKGYIVFNHGELISYPAYHIEPVDTTGAGDAFHGAFLRALDLHFDFDKAIRFSSAVSAIACQTPGGRSGIPDLKTTMDFMAAREVPTSSLPR